MANFSKIKEQNEHFWLKARAVFLAVFVPNEGNCFLPKMLEQKYLFWYGALLLAVKIGLISLALILPSTDFFSAIAADRLAALINQERQKKNLPALTLNAKLNSAAGLKVSDMLAQNYFEHTSPAGITPWHWFKQADYNFTYAGENLAMGFTETDAVFQAWMNSPTHRDNILNPNFQEMGLAVKSGQIQNHNDTLAALEFGRRAESAKAQIAQNPAPKKTPTASPAPIAKKATISPISPSLTSPSVAPQKTPTPMQTIQATPSRTPSALALSEQVELKTPLYLPPGQTGNVQIKKIGYAPKVLGAFVSKSDELFKSLYLYFTLFLAIALLVNIFVKIEIQYWATITAATLIIVLSTALIFI